MIIKEIMNAIDLHFQRAEKAYQEIVKFERIDSSIFADFEKIKTVDTFIFRFIKIQDLIGDKLFKEFLIVVGNYKDNMTMLDMLDNLEKIKIIENASTWMDYRNLRNILTHEYPDNEEEIIDGIKLALTVFWEMNDIYQRILEYLNKRKIK